MGCSRFRSSKKESRKSVATVFSIYCIWVLTFHQFRGWIDDLLKTSWEACQGTDVLIESPSAMGGIHIAEALAIPYFRAFTMTWTRTRAYPHAFAVPEHKVCSLGTLRHYIQLIDRDRWVGVTTIWCVRYDPLNIFLF